MLAPPRPVGRPRSITCRRFACDADLTGARDVPKLVALLDVLLPRSGAVGWFRTYRYKAPDRWVGRDALQPRARLCASASGGQAILAALRTVRLAGDWRPAAARFQG